MKKARSRRICIYKVNAAIKELEEAKSYVKRKRIRHAKKAVTNSLLYLHTAKRCISKLKIKKVVKGSGPGGVNGVTGASDPPGALDPPGATGATGTAGVTGVTGANGLVQQFQVSENTPNTTGSSAIALNGTATTLKTITITSIPAGGRVWLTGIIGWQNTIGDSSLQFQILRGATIIFSINDGRAGNGTFGSTSIDHVDLTPGTGSVTYSLMGLVTSGSANVVGAVTFTGALL
ncbi:hypothetical protein [Paenibacillus tuaregi]|uniref:hypothetical protein n=1 Tax=Paenibacillus tuaregi TaxID=1816681 RepID=UPI000837FF36|nr:hypothetical protein [Paenibacillus tuaregi]